MKKVIRLTESDLIRVVKRIINEEEDTRKISLFSGLFGNKDNEKAKEILNYLESGKVSDINSRPGEQRYQAVFEFNFEGNEIVLRNTRMIKSAYKLMPANISHLFINGKLQEVSQRILKKIDKELRNITGFGS